MFDWTLLQDLSIDLTREDEEFDSPVIGTDPPVLLLEKGETAPQIGSTMALSPMSIWCCKGVSIKTAQPNQSLEDHMMDCVHSRFAAVIELFNYLYKLHPGYSQAHPKVPRLKDVLVGLRRSSKYYFHCPTTSMIEVNSTSPPLYTVLVKHSFPASDVWQFDRIYLKQIESL